MYNYETRKERIYLQIKKVLRNGLRLVEIDQLPAWAERQLPRMIHKRYNRNFYFKGSHYNYKYTNRLIVQGNGEEHYYKRKIKSMF